MHMIMIINASKPREGLPGLEEELGVTAINRQTWNNHISTLLLNFAQEE